MNNNTVTPEENAGIAAAADCQPVIPKKKKTGRIVTLCILGVLVLAAAAAALNIFLSVSLAYRQLEQGEYEQAKARFQAFSFIPSLTDMPLECDYAMAADLMDKGEYQEAHDLFESISGYKDADEQSNAAYYALAVEHFDNGEYPEANEIFHWLGDYKDCGEMLLLSTYSLAEQHCETGDYEQAAIIFTDLSDYRDSADRAVECRIDRGIQLYEQGSYLDAASALKDYAEQSDEARLYLHLSNFEYYKSAGFSAFGVELYEELTLCSAYSEKAAEALLDPFFYYARCYGANWKSGKYYMDCRSPL